MDDHPASSGVDALPHLDEPVAGLPQLPVEMDHCLASVKHRRVKRAGMPLDVWREPGERRFKVAGIEGTVAFAKGSEKASTNLCDIPTQYPANAPPPQQGDARPLMTPSMESSRSPGDSHS